MRLCLESQLAGGSYDLVSFSLNSCLDEKEKIAAYMKLACSTVFVCFYYSTSYNNADFSSFKSLTKESGLL